jgi:hypothetical protein
VAPPRLCAQARRKPAALRFPEETGDGNRVMSDQGTKAGEPRESRASAAGEVGSLVAALGLKGVFQLFQYAPELGLFHLIALSFHEWNARSLRDVARILRAPPQDALARRVWTGLPKSLRAVHRAVAVLEELTGDQLVRRTGEGRSYDKLTEKGEWLKEQAASFAREFWA